MTQLKWIGPLVGAAFVGAAIVVAAIAGSPSSAAADDFCRSLERYYEPPAEFQRQFGDYRSPLKFYDGRPVRNAYEWAERRNEIRRRWHELLGPWPALIERPKVEIVETTSRENFTQHKVRVETAPGMLQAGYLLVPAGEGPFPAVVVPYYDPETSVGLAKELRDFAVQLTRRGFVTLSIGSPGGDARLPDLAGAKCQPLSFLGYIAANCYNALAARTDVDPRRIGIVGHSYGGKWALFGSCLYDKFACAVWSDPGIVFDEKRGSVNYWEPWYLGLEAGRTRRPGLISAESPRTGPYARLIAEEFDLHELHALMAPRPFLVSGGSEDFPARWIPLNHSLAVNDFLGVTKRVAMTNRPDHAPTTESNEQIYAFFECRLKAPPPRTTSIVAHRGLLRDAPENTSANFNACLDVQLGFEFDVRRTRDGVLVCVHDETLDRTTDGEGKVVERTLAEIEALDAGTWFAPEFRGTRVPTIEAVLRSIADRPASQGIYAVDMKSDDDAVEADVVRMAQRLGVLDRLLFIGRTIDQAEVRRRLRAASSQCHTAALANNHEEFSAALADGDADWVYLRFLPTEQEIAAVRAAGKRSIVAGPTVAGRETANWSQAAAAGVDAVLTDYALDARRTLAGIGN